MAIIKSLRNGKMCLGKIGRKKMFQRGQLLPVVKPKPVMLQ